MSLGSTPPIMAPHDNIADQEASTYDYDLIVIGAGSAGVRTARKVAAWGGKTAVVELPLHPDKHNSTIQLGGVGGGCVLRGCVPKKLLQKASDMVQYFEDSSAFGWEIDREHPPKHNWSKLIQAQREAVHILSEKWEAKLISAGVDIMWGWGSVKGPHTVNVDSDTGHSKQYTAKNIVVAAGSRPASLAIPGAELCINYNEALALPACPKKVAVVGAASAIGMALAGTFAGFRCEVHVVCPEELPLGPGVDKEVAAFALEQYRAHGHVMHMGCEAVEVQDAERNNWHKQEQQKQQQEQQEQGSEQRQEAAHGAIHSPLDPARMAGHAAVVNGVPVNKKGGAVAGRAADVTAEEDQDVPSNKGHHSASEQDLLPKTPPPEEEPLMQSGTPSDSGGDSGDTDSSEDLVTATGVTALPEAYASDDPKVTSVSTTRDTHKVLERGLRSLAIRRVDNTSGDATTSNGTGSQNDPGSSDNTVSSSSKGGSDDVEWLHDFDYVIMDVGRVPHTQDLGLEEVGVQMGEQGRVLVDDYLRTNIRSIWAAGEVSGRMMYQPAARMEGHALARTLWLGESTRPNYWAMPMPIWSTPQGAAVGLTEEEAAEQLDNVAIYTNRVTPLVCAVTGSKRPVFIKLIVDMDTDVIKGLHMIGDQTIEIVQGFAVCVKVGITKTQLDSTIGIHPSLAEEVVTMNKPARIVGRKADKQPNEAGCIDG